MWVQAASCKIWSTETPSGLRPGADSMPERRSPMPPSLARCRGGRPRSAPARRSCDRYQSYAPCLLMPRAAPICVQLAPASDTKTRRLGVSACWTSTDPTDLHRNPRSCTRTPISCGTPVGGRELAHMDEHATGPRPTASPTVSTLVIWARVRSHEHQRGTDRCTPPHRSSRRARHPIQSPPAAR